MSESTLEINMIVEMQQHLYLKKTAQMFQTVQGREIKSVRLLKKYTFNSCHSKIKILENTLVTHKLYLTKLFINY